jgi:hypothetical protein
MVFRVITEIPRVNFDVTAIKIALHKRSGKEKKWEKYF